MPFQKNQILLKNKHFFFSFFPPFLIKNLVTVFTFILMVYILKSEINLVTDKSDKTDLICSIDFKLSFTGTFVSKALWYRPFSHYGDLAGWQNSATRTPNWKRG